MAAVTICSDFGAQKDKVWHCFPIYFPWSDGTRCHDLLGKIKLLLFSEESRKHIREKQKQSLKDRLGTFPERPRLIMWASLVAQRLKCLPPMRETWVRSLGWEDPLEKEMATHPNILAWRIPWTEEPGRLQSTGSQRVYLTANLNFSICLKLV